MDADVGHGAATATPGPTGALGGFGEGEDYVVNIAAPTLDQGDFSRFAAAASTASNALRMGALVDAEYTATLNATATDAVGVTKVEFYVDGALKGTDTTAPYSMTLDSTTLTNGTHALVVKAFDAAGNIGTSTSVSFTVSNTTTTEKMVNGGSKKGMVDQSKGVKGDPKATPAMISKGKQNA